LEWVDQKTLSVEMSSLSIDFSSSLLFNHLPEEESVMESVAYILILALALGVLFFAIAFREPPRIGK